MRLRVRTRGALAWAVIVVLALGSATVGCGSSSDDARTGIDVHNNATSDGGPPNVWTIVNVTIGGSTSNVAIPPGETVFLPTIPGLHTITVHYSDVGNTTESSQDPPDPVNVGQGQVVFVNFRY